MICDEGEAEKVSSGIVQRITNFVRSIRGGRWLHVNQYIYLCPRRSAQAYYLPNLHSDLSLLGSSILL